MLIRLLLILGCSLFVSCQAHAAQWARSYGGPGNDYFAVAQLTPDGGYIAAGSTSSFGAGGSDAWVLKLGANGDIVWQKTHGGSTDDYATAVALTSDGGFLVVGQSAGVGLQGFPYFSWVLKLDAGGNLLREDIYAGTNSFHIESVHASVDGGYIVAGEAHSIPASGKVWLLKADSAGQVVWERVFGGGFDDRAYALQPTPDGGYVLAGRIVAAGGANTRVMKLDASGNVTWQRLLASPRQNEAFAVQLTGDGGYVVSGPTASFGAGNGDAWVVKLDAGGNVVWQKAYGGAVFDAAYDLVATGDGGFVVAGVTRSFGAGQDDVWLFKLNGNGGFLWQRTFGGVGAERVRSVRATGDGGFIVAGEAQSFGTGGVDAWLLRVGPTGVIPGCPAMGGSNATVVESTAAISDVATTLIAWSAVPSISSAIYAAANASSQQQCSGEALLPVEANIPTLSEWALVSLALLLAGLAVRSVEQWGR